MPNIFPGRLKSTNFVRNVGSLQSACYCHVVWLQARNEKLSAP